MRGIFQSPLYPGWEKKMGGRSLRQSRKSLLSAARVQKRLESSTHLLNDLKNPGIKFSFFSDEKTFTVDFVFRDTIREWYLWTPQSTNSQTSALNHDACHRNIKRGEDAPDLVSTEILTNLCCLKWSFGDESLSNSHYKTRLSLPKGRNSGTYGKDLAGLVGRQHRLLAQRLLVLTVTRFEPLNVSLWTHIEEKACKTRHSNADVLKVSVNCVWWSMRKRFVSRSERAYC